MMNKGDFSIGFSLGLGFGFVFSILGFYFNDSQPKDNDEKGQQEQDIHKKCENRIQTERKGRINAEKLLRKGLVPQIKSK